jgi:hypothetical protein
MDAGGTEAREWIELGEAPGHLVPQRLLACDQASDLSDLSDVSDGVRHPLSCSDPEMLTERARRGL